MKFNERLLDLRKKNGWSQEELGEKLDVSRQTISKWEAGQTTPELEKLRNLSKIFNISVDELINEEEEKRGDNGTNEDNKQVAKKKIKKFSKLKKFMLLIILSLIVFYIIIVAKRVKIILAVEDVLIDTLSKFTYLEINQTEFDENDDRRIESDLALNFYRYQIGERLSQKVEVWETSDDSDFEGIRKTFYEIYENDAEMPYKEIEVNHTNSSYQVIENLPIEYNSITYLSRILSEYQKSYNTGLGEFNGVTLLMAMDLRIKITEVDNGAMKGYYISDKNVWYEDCCSLKVDTLTKTIMLEKATYNEKIKNIVFREIYRYKYSDDAVKLEDVTLPDLTGYTLIESSN